MNSLWNTNIIVPDEGIQSVIESWNTDIIVPVEDDIKPFTGEYNTSFSDALDLDEYDPSCSFENIPGFQFGSGDFDEEEYFDVQVLNPCGGVGPSISSAVVDEYLINPEIKFLDNVKDFEDRGINTPRLKPVKENGLIKLAQERMPFYESRQNLIIAQKRLDMHKATGRLSFVMSEIGEYHIDRGTEIRMFLRDVQTRELIDLDLTVPPKDRCKCFKEHSRSLFCVRSKYEDAVQVTWSEDKLKAVITVVEENKFEILFAPLVFQRIKQNLASIFLELVFEIESEDEIFEQSYFIKFCSYPSRDIEHFIKKLVKEHLVDESFLNEFKKPNLQRYKLFRVEYDEKHNEEFKQFLKTIGGQIAEFK